MNLLRGIAGIALLIGLAWALSTNRRRFPLRTVLGGMALQWLLALAVLQTDVGRDVFTAIATVVTVILDCTNEGARFVLGNLVDVNQEGWGVVFAAKVLPSIIVFSSLSALGYHLGILQFAVALVAKVMTRLMGVSGAESLSAAGNVFLGQTGAPLLVRPYIPTMTQSELMALMVGGFATIAGGVLASYVAILGGDDPEQKVEVARHFLTACLMSAPASFVIAKIMLPETEVSETATTVRIKVERQTHNLVHAAATGAADGLKLALNVTAMLIAFIALIAVLDRALIFIGGLGPIEPLVTWLGLERLDLGGILGLIFAPVAYIIGAEPADCRQFGALLGKAMATHEFVA